MAKTVNGDIVVFDAEDQGEGIGPWMDTQPGRKGFVSLSGHTVVYDFPIYVDHLKIVTGSGGDVEIRSRKVDPTADPTEFNKPDERKRYNVVFLDATPANDTLWVPIRKRVDGLYIFDLPTNGQVQAYLGNED